MIKLSQSFYTDRPVTELARALLGKVLATRIKGSLTSGVIVETEAYSWIERGCHAYNNRRTARNEIMFGPGGHAYVYLCYGIHSLFNVVTGKEGVAEAVLIRAIEPAVGEKVMSKRRGAVPTRFDLTSGPGKLTVAMGIERNHNGMPLQSDLLWIDHGRDISAKDVVTGPRIGMNFPGKDALLPWRYSVRNNPWVSKAK